MPSTRQLTLTRQIAQWPLVVILGASLALVLVPPLWIRSVPGVDALSSLVSQAVPGTRHYILHSSLPEIATVYFPLMLLLSPLHFLWMWRLGSSISWEAEFANSPIKASLRLLVALGLTALVAFGTLAVGGGQLSVVPWNESKLALALAGHIASGGGFFIALAAVALGCRGAVRTLRARPDAGVSKNDGAI